MPRPAALAREIDLELSWSERELPERERTKHVHRLHPYLGKFVPQLAEVFLCRFGRAGTLVWDPFVGSGTTLVEANALGMRSAGCDLSAFNCLLARVKTAPYDPGVVASEADVLIGRLGAPRRVPSGEPPAAASSYLERWFAPGALRDLLAFRERLEDARYPELWAVVLSRAARSARLARHDDLDFPREPVGADYFCHKHRRVCRPVGEAEKFLRRYIGDAVRRIEAFTDLRTDADVTVLAGDARVIDPPGPVDLVLTSPPYPGLIDYHEQHAYAFELLGLERRDSDEIGRGVKGYCRDVAAVLRRAAQALRPRGRVVIVVNDSRGLYDGILAEANLELEERLLRHVNRRTGRRNGEYYEEVLIARP
ncbi:MAG: site-specific DNA-methyltransferase [Actinomycetota bacterium]|nr:site-specific DNA-methyltransferase [Actinomycetota bacterium]